MIIVALIAVSFAMFVSRIGLATWIRETVRKIHEERNWNLPGKIETSAEWFQELRPDFDWSVRTGSYGLASA